MKHSHLGRFWVRCRSRPLALCLWVLSLCVCGHKLFPLHNDILFVVGSIRTLGFFERTMTGVLIVGAISLFRGDFSRSGPTCRHRPRTLCSERNRICVLQSLSNAHTKTQNGFLRWLADTSVSLNLITPLPSALIYACDSGICYSQLDQKQKTKNSTSNQIICIAGCTLKITKQLYVLQLCPLPAVEIIIKWYNIIIS